MITLKSDAETGAGGASFGTDPVSGQSGTTAGRTDSFGYQIQGKGAPAGEQPGGHPILGQQFTSPGAVMAARSADFGRQLLAAADATRPGSQDEPAGRPPADGQLRPAGNTAQWAGAVLWTCPT